MDTLTEKLKSLHSASATDLPLLRDLFIKTHFRKGWILDPFYSIPSLYYIETGLVRGSVTYKEESYTIRFQERGFLTVGNELFSENASLEAIEFLRDTTGYRLNLKKADEAANTNSNLYKILLEIYEENLSDGKQREVMLHIKNAKDRFCYLIDHFPQLAKVLTDVQAADLLRIEKKYYYRIKKAVMNDRRKK